MNTNKQQWKRMVAVGVVVGALGLGVVGVSAQGNGNGDGNPPGLPGLFDGRGGNGNGHGFGPGGRFGQGGERGFDGVLGEEMIERLSGRWLTRFVAAELGLTRGELNSQLQQDQPLSAIITAAGADPAAIVTAAVAQATTALDQAVANGRITQAQADALLTDLQAEFAAALDRSPLEERIYNQGERMAVQLAAELLAIAPRDLLAQWATGGTLADLLTAGGVDVAAYLTDLSARLEARLNVAVVDGDVTAERAAELLSSFQTYIEGRVNETITPAVAPVEGV